MSTPNVVLCQCCTLSVVTLTLNLGSATLSPDQCPKTPFWRKFELFPASWTTSQDSSLSATYLSKWTTEFIDS